MNTASTLIVCALFLLPFRLFCQIDEWTTPVPLTDSLTDNRNAMVIELDFYDGWDHYVFWEKSFDSASSHIYTMKYYSQNEPVALVEGDYISINPCILKVNNPWFYPPYDTSFYLFYLSNQGGNFDIYYRIYAANGLSEPIAFLNTPGDEKHLRSNSANGLTWEYEGKIMYSGLRKENNGHFYFTDIVVVDSGNCRNPVLEVVPYFDWGEKYLAWEKEINDSSKVMLSRWDYPDAWSVPEMIYDTGDCSNLLFEESSFSEVATTLSWDQLDAAGNRKIVCTDPSDPYLFFLDLNQQMEYFPTVFNIFVGVSDIWFFAVMSFIKEENGQSDVYGGYQSSWLPDYVNLSNSSTIETNPHLWNGVMYYDKQDVINIWESSRNGHWQLYTSKIQVPIAGSVGEEKDNNKGLLSVSPNPFKNQITISFRSKITAKASIVLFDNLGRQLGILLEPEVIQGEQSWSLDPEKITGRELPSGIYFITLHAEGKDFSVKLFRSVEQAR